MFNKTKPVVMKKDYNKVVSFLKAKQANREDKDNIFPTSITEQEFIEAIKNLFLGQNWYTVSPLGYEQVLFVMLDNILFELEHSKNIK